MANQKTYNVRTGEVYVNKSDVFIQCQLVEGGALMRARLDVGINAEPELALLLAETVRAGMIDITKLKAAFELATDHVNDKVDIPFDRICLRCGVAGYNHGPAGIGCNDFE